ncbi:MAG TPA: SPOR domain-containing protein, partial [Pseudomonadales bacterium]|nr:SPOR domain-containing protein [Pseudomonadales bacterium]
KVAPGVVAVPADPSPSVKPDSVIQEPGSGVTVGAVANNSRASNPFASMPINANSVAVNETPAVPPKGTKAVRLGNGKTIFVPVEEDKAVAPASAPAAKTASAKPEAKASAKPATVVQTGKPTVVTGKPAAAVSKTPAVASKPTATDKTANEKAKSIYLQVGAYAQRENAEIVKDKLNKLKLSRPVLINNDQSKHRVQIGPFENEQLATQMQQRIRDANMGAAMIVRN